jgi:hypothetical protein
MVDKAGLDFDEKMWLIDGKHPIPPAELSSAAFKFTTLLGM